jgi:hypothetical protein
MAPCPQPEENAMNLIPPFLRSRTAPSRRRRRAELPDWVQAGTEPSPEQLDEVLLGCGWFDSSHELHAGLQVTEHLSPDGVVNDVPLGWWLDWLTCTTPAAGGGPSTAGRGPSSPAPRCG